MISIIRQPPNDEFTLRLFFKIINDLELSNKKFDAFYLWSLVLPHGGYEKRSAILEDYSKYINPGCTDPDGIILKPAYYKKFIIDSITNDLVIMGIKDHLTDKDFNPWLDAQPMVVNILTDIFEAHKNKKFILFTSLENLDAYIKYKNVSIIPWGGDITNQMTEYKTLPKFLEKDLSSDKIFLNLNRHKRSHRTYLLSLLLGLGLEDRGLLSCMFAKDLNNNLDSNGWKIDKLHKQLFTQGYEKLISYDFNIKDSYDIYPNIDNNNSFNFQNSLINYYKKTFVEIIVETSFGEECFLITEKTANCFFGCSFPIWISSKGTVKFLRDLGLDVYDDIINHSYDNISHPVDRLIAAITDNISILQNPDVVKQLWIENKNRFYRNIDFLQNNFFNKIHDRAYSQFKLYQ